MALATADNRWYPDHLGPLLDNVIDEKSIAAQVSTIVNIGSTRASFPLLAADPDTNWTAEGAQIALDDPTLTELEVTPKKVAGLTQLSNEAVNDSNPDVANIVGNGLARSIAKKLDAGYFALTTAANAATAIGTQAYSTVDTGATLANLDSFVDAVYLALANGAEITHFVVSPATAQVISKLKEASGSNKNLVTIVDDGMRIYGRTVLVSPDVDAATKFWALDKSQSFFVRRTGTEVITSGDSVFAYDSMQIRGTARVGFGWQNPAGVVRGYDAA